MWVSECLTHYFSLFPAVLLLLVYLHIHRAIPCLFCFLIHCDDDEVSFWNPANSFCINCFVCINGHYLPPWIINNRTSFACYRPIFTFDLGCTKQNLPSCSYLKVDFFGWLFVSYLPVLISIIPSSYIGNRMFFSSTLLVTGGPLTCWMWISLKKTSWVDFRDMEVVICRTRMVHAYFTPPPVCKQQRIRIKWNESSCFLCLRLCI